MPKLDKTIVAEAQQDVHAELLIAKMCAYFTTCAELAEAQQILREDGWPSDVHWETQIKVAALTARGEALEEICVDLARIYESRG